MTFPWACVTGGSWPQNNSGDQAVTSGETSAVDARRRWNQIWGWDSSSQSFRSKIDDGRWWACAHSPRMKSSTDESVFLSLVLWCFAGTASSSASSCFYFWLHGCKSALWCFYLQLFISINMFVCFFYFIHSPDWCEWSWRRIARRHIPHPQTPARKRNADPKMYAEHFHKDFLLRRSITQP